MRKLNRTLLIYKYFGRIPMRASHDLADIATYLADYGVTEIDNRTIQADIADLINLSLRVGPACLAAF
ncbi:MAG: hypothetical protein IJS30_04415 [Bacteroidales bacterium]|nr:hypothetical protein [Bacteroidales bacterium]